MSTKILKGLRVIDLSRMLSGPYCTMHLADHGAEVIKIESSSGDTSRGNGPFREDDTDQDWAGYFISLNRGKKSIQIDLKSDLGRTQFRALAATADVIVESFRPGVMDRLGLAYEMLAADNPRLVYAAIRGYGDPRSGKSPYADWPSYDVVAQAIGGLMSITGADANSPTKTGPGVGDIFAGMMMAFGIMAALREAEATGKGQFVDVAMYDAMISLCERMVYQHDITKQVPGPEGNGHPFLSPFGLYPASDGYIALGIVDDAFWQKLAKLMDHPELAADPRFATRANRATNATVVDEIVSAWSSKRSKSELTKTLGGKVPFGPLNTIADIKRDPHTAARKMLAKINTPFPNEKPWIVAANPLRFGAHNHGELTAPPVLGADAQILDELIPTKPIDPKTIKNLRDAFGRFATGVTVVTTRQDDSIPRGFTANSFTSVSLDPPLLLVCISKTALSCESFIKAKYFAINILADDQREISGLFASRSADKFDNAAWHYNEQNVPLIDGALANFSCAQHRLVDAGDHIILIGRVIDLEMTDGKPLGYYKGAYFDIGLDRAVTDAATTGNVTIGAVLAYKNTLLLVEKSDGSITLPNAHSVGALSQALINKGLKSAINQLYAVYQVTSTGAQRIIYHGEAEGNAINGLRFYDLNALPLDKVVDDAERSLLQRYAKENRYGTFGIYHGTEVEGVVHTLAGNHKYQI